MKVALLGAGGGIGQPLALLLKANTNVTHLSLYDLVLVPGVAADLSHINTRSKVTAHVGDTKDPSKDQLPAALEGADVVVITAGVARKPGMTRDDLFNINAGIISNLASGVAKYCPKAFVCVITNPVNSTVPIVAEVLKHYGVYDPKRVFGVTTLDVVRASTFVSDIKPNVDPNTLRVTVVGGHSGATIVPLLSQTGISFTDDELKALTNRIQFGGDEVVKAKDGAGSATLSMAFAGARFVTSLLEAINGKTGVIEPTYVKSDVYAQDGIEYFSSNVELGKQGVAKIHSIGVVSAYEKELLSVCLQDLKKNIQKGVDFALQKKAAL